jgi:hypothetical protein
MGGEVIVVAQEVGPRVGGAAGPLQDQAPEATLDGLDPKQVTQAVREAVVPTPEASEGML